jgi:hypothetical protein
MKSLIKGYGRERRLGYTVLNEYLIQVLLCSVYRIHTVACPNDILGFPSTQLLFILPLLHVSSCSDHYQAVMINEYCIFSCYLNVLLCVHVSVFVTIISTYIVV